MEGAYGYSMLNDENKSQRELYIRKNEMRKQSKLSSYINLVKHQKKIKVKKYQEPKHEYRPWSANNSDKSD